MGRTSLRKYFILFIGGAFFMASIMGVFFPDIIFPFSLIITVVVSLGIIGVLYYMHKTEVDSDS